jgi:hypothetical protein
VRGVGNAEVGDGTTVNTDRQQEDRMGNALRLAVVMCGAVLCAVTWSSDVAADADVDDDDASSTSVISPSIAEPITEPPVVLAPSADTGPKNPLVPYGTGPAAEAVPYDALSPEEQAVASRGLDATNWTATHNAFAAAVVERSKHARAEAAQHQLGVDGLDRLGVIQ